MPRVSVNDVELNWGAWGEASGATLLLCHGYTGSSHDFSLQAGALANSRRVVTFDQRGHGRSTKTGHVAGYTIDQLSADLINFLEQVSDDAVDLLGHSMGARAALGVVLARPDLVRSLVLLDTSAWSFQSENESVRTLVAKYLDEFDPTRGVPSSFGLVGPEDALIEAATPSAWRQEKEAIFRGMDAYAIKALGMELLSTGIRSVRAPLPSITCPTTVIVGSHDHPLVDQAPELAAEVADGRLVVIDGAYHAPHLTHPGVWRDAVETHLARS